MPITADRVYAGRTRQLAADHEPTLLVYTGNESAERSSNGWPPVLERLLSVRIEVRVVSVGPPDDILDAIAAEVELAIWNDVKLGGLALDARLQFSDQRTEADSRSHLGVLTLEYLITYHAHEGAAVA